jgi:hypothetical protein
MARKATGFSVIEIMLVVSMLLFIGNIASSINVSQYQQSLVQEDRNEIIRILRAARAQAQYTVSNLSFGATGVGSTTGTGIHVENNTVISFTGSEFSNRVKTEDVEYQMRGDEKITATHDIVFSTITGTSPLGGIITIHRQAESPFAIRVFPDGSLTDSIL